MRKAGILDNLKRLRDGMTDAYGEGRDDRYVAYKRGRKAQGYEEEGPRLETTLGTNRTLTMLRDLLGMSDPKQRQAREDMGMGLSNDGWTRAGQIIGHIGNDLTEDTSRSIYWLLNAPQATANVINEEVVHRANPDLYNAKDIMQRESGGNLTFNTKAGNPDYEEAVRRKMMSTGGELRKGYRQANIGGEQVITKRRYNPGHVSALAIPAGIAMNAGLGLLTPFGGAEGYKAALPDDEDPTQTSNVLGEIGAKYLLGRTGNLLPWEEFKEVRPDVSKDEYMRYKAFKFDNDGDINPFDDGQVSLPTGILKYTNEGIHGPEVQFMGRSIPVTTGIIPTATATLGTALGVMNKRAPIRSGFVGGIAGLIGGQVTGNALEQERRRRNAAANEMDA